MLMIFSFGIVLKNVHIKKSMNEYLIYNNSVFPLRFKDCPVIAHSCLLSSCGQERRNASHGH